MAGSVNKVTLVGNVGKDPEIRSFQSVDKVANFSLATSESWKDKATGERKEKTEWHKVSVTNQGLVTIIEKYVKKGSKVYLEGQLETKKYDKDGVEHYSTQVTLKPFKGELVLLDGRNSSDNGDAPSSGSTSKPSSQSSANDLDDDIPF